MLTLATQVDADGPGKKKVAVAAEANRPSCVLEEKMKNFCRIYAECEQSP